MHEAAAAIAAYSCVRFNVIVLTGGQPNAPLEVTVAHHLNASLPSMIGSPSLGFPISTNFEFWEWASFSVASIAFHFSTPGVMPSVTMDWNCTRRTQALNSVAVRIR